MIQVIVDPESIKIAKAKIENKVKQAEFAVSPRAMTEVAKAVFTITARKFIRDISLEASLNPSKYHHLYEWNKIGSPTSKLFIMKRTSVQYGNLVITFEPTKSNTFVPINPKLLVGGPTGKTVSSRYIFRDKAKVMEDGSPVEISSNKIMVFYSDNPFRDNVEDGLVFVPAGQSITVRNPGGSETKGALKTFATEWYMFKSGMTIQSSRLIGQIGNAVAAAINIQNSSTSTVLRAIQSVTAEYSQEISVM